MLLDSSTATALQRYKILSNSITPRPIAWISTISQNGSVNLAPFSFFAPISVNPPMFSLCMMSKANGEDKDTLRNLKGNNKASIAMCDITHIKALNDSANALDYGESEASVFDIALEVLESSYPPVPKGVKVAFLCELHDILHLGDEQSVLVKVKHFYVDDSIYDENLSFLPEFVGRVGRIYKLMGAQIELE